MYDVEDTIAAIATPPGEGGVAIVRLSGRRAVEIANTCFSGDVSSYATHTAHYGKVVDGTQVVDGALVLVMLDGRSYTGEETVEIQGHGGPIISRRVLETVLKAGARAAKPGEFTYRAYMNGKIDLAQAEAVQELICAHNDYAVDAANDQLQGLLSTTVARFQHDLSDVAGILEAWVDFPEEGLEFTSFEELGARLQGLIDEMQALVDTFSDGKVIHEGVSLCLVGAPNVGKSSLLNALLDQDRAIVTPIAGTTRDTLEADMRLDGLNLRLIDTAGIRETDELVEQEGIRRTKSAIDAADLVLQVIDATNPQIVDLPHEKTLTIYNKIDIEAPSHQNPDYIYVSAKNRTNLDTLKAKINEKIWTNGSPPRDQLHLTNVRHKEALTNTIVSLKTALTGLQTTSPEFLCLDLRDALHSLSTIIGTNITEDLLSAIFSRFCLGK